VPLRHVGELAVIDATPAPRGRKKPRRGGAAGPGAGWVPGTGV